MSAPNEPQSRAGATPAAPRWIALAAWTGFILFMTLSSAPPSAEMTGRLGRWLAALGLPDWAAPKVFHVVAYAAWMWLATGALGGGYRRGVGRRALGLALAGLAVLASGQEALQALTPARHPAWFDVGLNLAGGLACAALRPLTTRPRVTGPR